MLSSDGVVWCGVVWFGVVCRWRCTWIYCRVASSYLWVSASWTSASRRPKQTTLADLKLTSTQTTAWVTKGARRAAAAGASVADLHLVAAMRPARKAAGEGKRDSWKALTSARLSVDEAVRRHLGQNEDGRDDGDARRSRARQVEVGPEHLQHQRAPDATRHRAKSATATGASWRAQVGRRCHRPRSGLKRGQPSRSRGARRRQPARWRAWSGAELAAAHLLMSSTVVARSVSSGWSRPYGGSGRPPCVGRPALDPLIVATPGCAHSAGARARWPGASRCGSVAIAVRKAVPPSLAAGDGESLAAALGQLKPSYKRPPSPPVAHWWRGDRRFAASAAPTPITDGCDRFRAGVTAEMSDTPAHLTVSGCVNFMDLPNMHSLSLSGV